MEIYRPALRTTREASREKPPFEEVYSRYYPGVLSYIRGKLDNAQDAEDLCSDAFLYCFDQYEKYDPEKSAVSTWLYLVVNSRIKNYYRDHRTNADIDELSNILPDEGQDMEQAVYLEQLRDTLAKAIATLPERQQKIVIMSYFQKLTSSEIAERLGLSPVNVRVLLNRSLSKLEPYCRGFKL